MWVITKNNVPCTGRMASIQAAQAELRNLVTAAQSAGTSVTYNPSTNPDYAVIGGATYKVMEE